MELLSTLSAQRHLLTKQAKIRLVQSVFAMLVAIAAGVTWQALDVAKQVDQNARSFREHQIEHPASGSIVLVEIDAKSLAKIDKWPWPRSIHAQIVDRLRDAQVETVAFDIDFSTNSKLLDDAKFAEALKNFGGTVILPTFRQAASADGTEIIDSEPIPILREPSILASVNVFPDADGVMRRYSNGGETTGFARPSMPALLSNSAASTEGNFWISSSVNPSDLPRYSVIDLLDAKVPLTALKGKTVLIGATAIEMGDRYATQGYGIQPGVVIQALAAETLLQKLDYSEFGALPAAILSTLLAGLLGFVRPGFTRTYLAAAGVVTVVAMPFFLEYFKLATFDISAAIIMLVGAYLGLKIQHAMASAYHNRMTDAQTGLPNMLSLRDRLANTSDGYLFVMKLTNLVELLALTGEMRRNELVNAIVRRIKVDDSVQEIFLTDDGCIAWMGCFRRVEDASEHANAVSALLVSAVHAADRAIIVRPAIGIDAIDLQHPQRAIDNAGLAADIAVERSCKWLVYTTAMTEASGLTQHVLSEIENAIQNGDIYFVYQPKYAFAAGRFCGAEALVRWTHSQLGPLPPDKFIPIMEKHGKMAALTLYSISVVEPILWQWHVEGKNWHLAVNISAQLLADKVFARKLEIQLNSLGAARRLLKLEVTESATVGDSGESMRLLQKLRALGCQISIDDYGTGNSTLSYLKDFPADEVKIDKSFITNIANSENDRALVRSTVELAHELKMQVVAEGVEDASCAKVVAELGCEMAQGWHFGKPMLVEDLEDLLDKDLAAAA